MGGLARFLVTLVFGHLALGALAMGKRSQYDGGGKGGSTSSRFWDRGGWHQQGSWGSRDYTRDIVVRVETERNDRRAKKDHKKKKHRKRMSDSSSSSSSVSSSPSKRKSKKKSRKDREDKDGDRHGLTNADMEELRQFRREAEFAKIRQEVRDSLQTENSSRPKPGTDPKLLFTPKTKKCILAQTRLLNENGSATQVVGSDFEVWEQVHEQLESQTAAVVKKLLAQFRRIPMLRCPDSKPTRCGSSWRSCRRVPEVPREPSFTTVSGCVCCCW